MSTTFIIVLVIAALITFDIIMDVILIKRMGYSVKSILRSSWNRFKPRWKRTKAPAPVVPWVNDEDVYDDDEDWSRP